jgi:hypothetical protein
MKLKYFIPIIVLSLLFSSCKKKLSEAFEGEWVVYSIAGQPLENQEESYKKHVHDFDLIIKRDGATYTGLFSMSIKGERHKETYFLDETNSCLIGGSILKYSADNDQLVCLSTTAVYKRGKVKEVEEQ